MRKNTVSWLALCTLIWAMLPLHAAADTSRQLPKYVRLVILHTNDVHGHMLPFEYHEEQDVGGIARRATMINSIRSLSRDAVLVLDAGDIFDRGPLDKAYHGEPDFAIMNAIPYDALVLGNNEFDGAPGMEGQKILFDRIRQARIPVVCANCTYEATGKTIVPPYVILKRNGIRFGIFGLTAPRVATYTTVEGLAIEDPIQCAKRIVPILKQEADVVIGLTHIGYTLDKQLAVQVPDIDIIVGGDSHTWVTQPELVRSTVDRHAFWVGGPIIVQDGEWGKCLGNLETILRLHGDHDYQVMSFTGGLVPVDARTPESKAISSILAPYTRPFEKVVGSSSETIANAEMTPWMARVFRTIGGTQVGIAQAGVWEGGIRQGPVTQLDLMRIPSFNNGLVRGSVTGETLRALIADQGIAIAGITAESLDLRASYTVCTQDFLTGTLQPLKGVAFQPVNKTIVDALNEYLAGTAN